MKSAQSASFDGQPATLPSLLIASGTMEAIKWLALALMTIDHINKYLYAGKVGVMFAIGRATVPLFAFVLACNLARPGAFEGGVHQRVMTRLALYGALATIPFIALGNVSAGWWPLNVMAMLLIATACLYFHQKGGTRNGVTAIAIFVLGGALVEFAWFGAAMLIAAWCYCRRPSCWTLGVWIGATAALYPINQNLWALAAFPIMLAAPYVNLRVARARTLFYAYYPLHFAALWCVLRLL